MTARGLRLRTIWGLAVAAWLATASQLFASDDPYLDLARKLAEQVTEGKLAVGLGNFLYEDTELMSAFSSLLREELERALAETGKFKVITRSRLADLQMEGKFQGMRGLDPDVGLKGVKIADVQALVRGRFYYREAEVTVSAELVWLEGGEVRKTKLVIPARLIGAKIWPDAAQTQQTALNSVMAPPQAVASQSNVADVEKRFAKVPHDFNVVLAVREGKRDFVEGETISYRVTPSVACHMAILCHQVDGSTVVLFPNEFQRNTWVAAGMAVDVPALGKDNFQITIQCPFGADVVQVIACTKASALHQMLAQYMAGITKGMGVRGIGRGMVVKELNDALSTTAVAATVGTGPTRWAEAHIVVCTYPKYGRPTR